MFVNTYDPDVDLLEVYKNNDIVYFTLPSNLIGETARAFGKMLLMDLKSTGGYIERKEAEKHFYPVFIDEFAEFATEEFVGWLNKARSSGFAIHLAHQSLGDLEQVNKAFVKQVIDNTNIKILFRVNDSETAESFAKQLGTFTTFKETERVDKSLLTQSEGFHGSLREVEEFIISPNEIKRELKRGQALIFGKHPGMFYTIINTDYIEDPVKYKEVDLDLVESEDKKDIGLNIERVLYEDHMEENIQEDFIEGMGIDKGKETEVKKLLEI